MLSVYFLHEKFEVFRNFEKFKLLFENQSSHKIKSLRSDWGIDYNSKEFEKFCETEGIEHQLLVSYCYQQIGVPERKHITMMEMARSMLLGKNLSTEF